MRSHSQTAEESNSELEEEVHTAEDYIMPRAEDAPEVKIPKSGKFPVPIPQIDSRIKEDGDLLGYAVVAKFIDYNLADAKTYPQFRPDQYLTIQKNPRTGVDDYIPMDHVQILERSGLLNLLRLPHFGCGAEVNAVVQILLSCLHGGYLWVGNKVDLNIDLIHCIIGLSKTGQHSMIDTTGKTKEPKLSPALVSKYQLQRGGRAYDIESIPDKTLSFTASLLLGRLLTKVRPKEVTGSVIKLAIQVAEGE